MPITTPHERIDRRRLRSSFPTLLAVLALLLAGCAPGGSGADPDAATVDDDAADAADDDTAEDATAEPTGDAAAEDEPAAEASVDLRVTVWTGNEDHLALFDSIAEAYIADNPAVGSIDFEVLPFEDYADAVTVQLAGGHAPDIGWVLERNAPELVQAGVLADIGPTLEATEGYALDDVSDTALSLWQADSAIYAYPFSTSPFGIFYNADMLTEAGVEAPTQLLADGGWTWDAVRTASDAVVEGGAGDHGLIVRDFNYELWSLLATVWGGWGAQAWSEDGTQCTFDQPEMVAAMTWFHDLVFDAGGHPGPGQSGDFFAGDSAMTITQISRANLLEDAGFEWGLVPLPEGPAGARQAVGQAGMGVFAASDHVEEATDFLAFFTNPENAAELAQFFPPPRQSLLNAEVLAGANPLLSEEQLEQVVVQGIAEGTVLPAHPNFAQLEDTVRAQLDALWESGADVEAVLAQVCEAAQPLLESR